MFIVLFIIFLAGTLYLLNKHFGEGYVKSLYNLSKEYIYTAFETKNLSSIALIIFWCGGFIALLLILYALGITPKDAQSHSINKLQLMGALAILLSAFIASMSVMKSIKHSDEHKESENSIKNSKFYLDNLVDGLEVVYNLLKDGNNNRVIWIEAARTLENTLNLRKKVTEPSHQEILEIRLMKYRHLFYKLFTTGENHDSLPTSFFSGIKEWKSTTDITKAMKQATSEIEAQVITEFAVPESPSLLYLTPSSIMSIYNFIKFPDTYEDPLDKFPSLKEINIDEYFKDMGYATGAKEYIRYLKKSINS